jgi:hypothetical protein
MKLSILLLIVLLCACAAESPRYGEVVTMRAGQAPAAAYPAPGTVWRLDEIDLKALSPAPLVPAPPPPNRPPPRRPNASYPPPPPYYGAPPYWGPGY